jgi:hypothetical protein
VKHPSGPRHLPGHMSTRVHALPSADLAAAVRTEKAGAHPRPPAPQTPEELAP